MTRYLLQREEDGRYYQWDSPPLRFVPHRLDRAHIVGTTPDADHAKPFEFHSVADATAATLPGRWRTVPYAVPADVTAA